MDSHVAVVVSVIAHGVVVVGVASVARDSGLLVQNGPPDLGVSGAPFPGGLHNLAHTPLNQVVEGLNDGPERDLHS